MRTLIVISLSFLFGCSAPDGMRVLNEHEKGLADIAVYAWDETYPEHQVSDRCYHDVMATGIYYAYREEFDHIFCGPVTAGGYAGFMCPVWLEWDYGIVILDKDVLPRDGGPAGYLVQECVIIHEFFHVLQHCEGAGGTFGEKSINHEGAHWQSMIDVVGCSFTGV